MPVAISPTSFVEYRLKEDRELPKAQQTVFHVARLSFRELCDLQECMVGDLELEEEGVLKEFNLRKQYDSVVKGLKIALRGWKNFKFEDGAEVSWSQQCVDGFSALSLSQCQELLQAALTQNSLSEEDEGNSKSSPELPKEVS